MKLFDINKFEIQIWERELTKARVKEDSTYQEYMNDPITELLNVHREFAQFLKDNKGKDRSSPKAMKTIKDLSIREKKANKKKDNPNYSISSLSDIYYQAKSKVDAIQSKVSNLKYYQMRNV